MSLLARTLLLTLLLTVAACESGPNATKTQPTAVDDGSIALPSGPVPANAPAARHFAAVRTAYPGNPEVIGSYTKGCIVGAAPLPQASANWQVAHPARNRAWGHPHLISFLQTLSAKVAADGHGGIIVGDLAQPRGGPLPSEHNSHQVGLDADVWLQPMPERRLSTAELDSYDPPSLVDFDTLRVTRGFGDAQYSILKNAAQSPGVERIFISPPIKREMCNRAPANDRDWLRKLRPWTGHAAHMHVRLACPADSSDCKAQDEPPEGDGCGSELQSWFTNRNWMKPSTGTYVPRQPMGLNAMPAACVRLLSRG